MVSTVEPESRKMVCRSSTSVAAKRPIFRFSSRFFPARTAMGKIPGASWTATPP